MGGGVQHLQKFYLSSRIPVFGESFDDILGIVKRRDLLQAYSEDRDALLVRDLMKKPLFVPETASALDALELLLRKHRQLTVVVDEYGSTAGSLNHGGHF